MFIYVHDTSKMGTHLKTMEEYSSPDIKTLLKHKNRNISNLYCRVSKVNVLVRGKLLCCYCYYYWLSHFKSKYYSTETDHPLSCFISEKLTYVSTVLSSPLICNSNRLVSKHVVCAGTLTILSCSTNDASRP